MRKLISLFRIKGLIIWLAVISLIAVFILVFMDSLLKKAFIVSSETINRAKVELDSLETDLTKTSVTLDNLSWTDREKPMRNLFTFNSAKLDIEAAPLLKKHVTIDNFSIDGLELDTERKTSGALAKSKETETANNETSKTETNNIFSKLKDIDISTAIDIEKIPAVKEARRLGSLAKEKAAMWNSKIAKAADTAELKATYEIIQKIDVESYNFPADILKAKKDAETVQAFIKQVQAKKNETDRLVKELSMEQSNISNELSNLKKMSQKAPKDLLMSADSNPVDAKAIVQELIGKNLTDTLTKSVALYRKYQHMIPRPEKGEAKPETVKRVSEKGTYVYFRKSGETPRVYIKNMYLNGSTKNGDILTGNIKNLSTDITYKPYDIDLKLLKSSGTTPFFTLGGQVGVVENAISTYLQISASGYPISDIIHPSDNNSLKGVSGNIDMQGQIKGTGEDFTLDIRLTSPLIGIDINSENMDSKLAELLDSAIGKVDNFTADLSASGTLDNYSINISTNLQDIISRNIKGYLTKQIQKVNGEIQKRYNEEMTKIFAGSENAIAGLSLNDSSKLKLKELTGLNSNAAEKNNLIKKAISGQAGSGALDKLKSKFPF